MTFDNFATEWLKVLINSTDIVQIAAFSFLEQMNLI